MIPFEVVRMEGGAQQPLRRAPLAEYVSVQTAAMRNELHMGLPVFTREDLRRYRMYEAESVLLELLSGGADWAAQMLWQLLQLDRQAREQLELAATRALRRPALARCPELLHALAVGLTEADKAASTGDRGGAGAQLLVLAELSWARGLSWWWLTERLLQLAAAQSRAWPQDDGLCEASVALARGAFLLHQLNECGEALKHLTLATQLSAGKPWRVAPGLLKLLGVDSQPLTLEVVDQLEAGRQRGVEQEQKLEVEGRQGMELLQPQEVEQGVFQLASRGLSQALVQEARAARKQQDCDRAAALCREAVQRAQDARALSLELAAQRELGVCLLAAPQPEEAAAAFRVFLSLAQRASSPRDIVTAHLKLALCCHSQGDSQGALRSLQDARQSAEELGQLDLLARAHAHLGELFLNTPRPHYATTHLHLACSQFAQLPDCRAESDRVRALAGVAGGLELLQPLVTAILESGPGQPGARQRLLQLLAWKDSREPFWPADKSVSRAVWSLGLHKKIEEEEAKVDAEGRLGDTGKHSKVEENSVETNADEGEDQKADNNPWDDDDEDENGFEEENQGKNERESFQVTDRTEENAGSVKSSSDVQSDVQDTGRV